MGNYEEKYKKFKINNETREHLVKLSSKRFPFDENSVEIQVETIWCQNGKQKKIEKGVAHAKLV